MYQKVGIRKAYYEGFPLEAAVPVGVTLLQGRGSGKCYIIKVAKCLVI